MTHLIIFEDDAGFPAVRVIRGTRSRANKALSMIAYSHDDTTSRVVELKDDHDDYAAVEEEYNRIREAFNA